MDDHPCRVVYGLFLIILEESGVLVENPDVRQVRDDAFRFLECSTAIDFFLCLKNRQ